MRSPLVPLLLGLALLAGAIGIWRQQVALQQSDLRDIAGLRAELDSVRAAARAAGGADSARLGRSVADRTYILGRREFHVPSRQARIDGWWSPTGPGTLMALVGGLLLGLAAVRARRTRRTSHDPASAGRPLRGG